MWIEIVADIIQYIAAVFLGLCLGIWICKKEREKDDVER